MKKLLLGAMMSASIACAHFGMVIPADSSIEQDKIDITFKFAHPFEGAMLQMDAPAAAGVQLDGKKTDLLASLKKQSKDNMDYYTASYDIKGPGAYIFYTDLAPYYEAAEQIFIHHTAKSVVNAYGGGDGWDDALGLKAEIIPLTRPFGLYKGNIFSAKVLYKGKPAPNVIVEVEYLNDKGLKAPSDDFITQEVKTNENGEFSFAMPLAGWWGFAALITDDVKIKKDGKDYPVELGAVIWVQTKDYK